MRIAAGRIFSAIITAGGWLIAGVRSVLDLIGYATVPEDAQVAGGILRQGLLYLMSLPWWLPWGFALISTLWLMYVSWPRASHTDGGSFLSGGTSTGSEVAQPDEDFRPLRPGVYEGSHEKLMFFVVDHLMPTYMAQCHAQYAFIEAIAVSPPMTDLARAGILNSESGQKLEKAASRLSRLHNSPPDFIPLDEMIDCVDVMEKNYSTFVAQGLALKKSEEEYKLNNQKAANEWENWRVAHNAMIEAYEAIKKDSNLGKLFRPVRESRWGGVALKVIPSGGSEPQSQKGTGA